MLVSKRKRYLSGADWGIGALDRMMKTTTCSGNMSQIVMVLDRCVDEQSLRKLLQNVREQWPVLQGHVKRDAKLAPYWKIPQSLRRDITLNVTHLRDASAQAAVDELLTMSANSVFVDDNEHIAFHLFTDPKRSVLAMTFDHRLFDARGAESFINLVQTSLMTSTEKQDIYFKSSSELKKWKNKFLAGRNVNRKLISLSKSTPVSLPMQADRTKGFRYRILEFNEKETAGIFENAYQTAGYLLESPFFLAAITHAFHKLAQRKDTMGDSYLIPVSMDLRPGREPLQEIFFNHVSYLFYQVPVTLADDLRALTATFKQQMYDQVKSGFPKDLAEASQLSRIVPLGLFVKLMQLPAKGKIGSFAYSHLGKTFYEHSEFLGGQVKNLIHMPRVPLPPGLGFFSNYYKKQLNFTISYWDGLLTEDEILLLEAEIRSSFGVPK